MQNPDITIVIPVRRGGSPKTTLESLAWQTYQGFDVVVSHDLKGNANWARNRGAEGVVTPFLLFSDDDITWYPRAIEVMRSALLDNPEITYAYGTYEINGLTECREQFDSRRLRRRNFISTMSLLRTKDFPGFDEGLKRLQDWALWLNLLNHGKVGAHCGMVIFRTEVRAGITYSGEWTYEKAKREVQAKYNPALVV